MNFAHTKFQKCQYASQYLFYLKVKETFSLIHLMQGVRSGVDIILE